MVSHHALVHPTWGTLPFLESFPGLGGVPFRGRVHAPTPSGNASRYAFRQVWNLVYFYLDEIEHIFYNLARENAHEKNDRFIIYYIEDD